MRSTVSGMKTTAKTISAVAYISLQADLAAREGAVSAKLADLFFQCAQVRGERTVEQWDALVVSAMGAGVTIADAIEFADE